MEVKITNLSKKFGDFTAVDNLNVTMTTNFCFMSLMQKNHLLF